MSESGIAGHLALVPEFDIVHLISEPDLRSPASGSVRTSTGRAKAFAQEFGAFALVARVAKWLVQIGATGVARQCFATAARVALHATGREPGDGLPKPLGEHAVDLLATTGFLLAGLRDGPRERRSVSCVHHERPPKPSFRRRTVGPAQRRTATRNG